MFTDEGLKLQKKKKKKKLFMDNPRADPDPNHASQPNFLRILQVLS